MNWLQNSYFLKIDFLKNPAHVEIHSLSNSKLNGGLGWVTARLARTLQLPFLKRKDVSKKCSK